MSDLSHDNSLKKIFSLPVLVAALGYMVDMYDLFLFNIVRVPSFKDIGVKPDEMLNEGLFILNLQMLGMLIGGIVWGILGDKKGRLSVLFGSILIYSLANIGNGFVQTIDQYAALRFIAGFGLAGELGVGITLVTEILPKAIRGVGTTIVAITGLLGAISAYFVVTVFDWRMSYFIGGGLGLLLLIMRISILESGMFDKIKHQKIRRGDITLLFANRERTMRFVNSILIGFPIWFVTGILIPFSPEFAASLGITEPVSAGTAVTLAFTGQVAGNMISGFGSQLLKSRKKVIGLFLVMSLALVLIYLLVPMSNADSFYIVCLFLGLFNGYWTLFITVAAELFGTNLRATVATAVPNLVRAAVIPFTWLFRQFSPHMGIINGALITGLIAFSIAFVSLWFLKETFSRDLDFVEE